MAYYSASMHVQQGHGEMPQRQCVLHPYACLLYLPHRKCLPHRT
jgi:hypothetical protein